MRNTIKIVTLTALLLLGLVVSSTAESDLKGLTVHRDVQYREIVGVDPGLLSLDIYAPEDASGLPVLMMVHGGGWSIGDKANRSLADTKPRYFCDNGYIYVSINYRLSPAVQHPAHIEDVAAAYAWLTGNVANYGGDPEHISIMGHSAGAQLVALLATDAKRLQAYGLDPAHIDTVICLDGAGYDIPGRMAGRPGRMLRDMLTDAFGSDGTLWEDASPTLHVTEAGSYPPFLILYTRRVDAPGQSMELAEALRSAETFAWEGEAADKTHMTINRDVGTAEDWVTILIMDLLADGSIGD